MRHQQPEALYGHLWFPRRGNNLQEVLAATGADPERVSALPAFSLGSHPVAYGAVALARSASQTFDLVHQHGIWLPHSLFTTWMSKRAKVIISPHGLLEPNALRMATTKKRICGWLYEQKNLEHAHCFMAASEQEAAGIRDYGLRQPIAVLPHGVESDLLAVAPISTQERLAVRQRWGVPPDARVMLFLSRVHPSKGLPDFIQAMAQVTDALRESRWALVVVGPDDLGHRAELEQLVSTLGLSDLVRFSGQAAGREKIRAFQSADCFVLPSCSENFGIVVLEALALGLPAMASQNTPWASLREARCGYWVERSVPAMRQFLAELCTTPVATLRVMGQSGRALARNDYAWEDIARRVAQVYRWLLGSGSEPDCILR